MGYLKSIVFGIALSLTFSCAAEPSFRHLVYSAEMRWYSAVCRVPRYRTIIIVPVIERCGKLDTDDIWGCYYPTSGQITLSAKIPRDKLLQVLTHEMGHSLAPGSHVPRDKGIMAPEVRRALPYITQADIDMVCEEYDCPCQRPEKP